MSHTFKLIFLFTLFATFSSCSAVKAKKEIDILKPANLSFIELAAFFPKDTIAVGRFQIDKFADRWFPLFSEHTADPEINALMKKRNQEFRTLLKKESIELLGTDISTAKEIVFALAKKGFVLAVQGEGKGKAQKPTSAKVLEIFHVRVIGNTILFYPKTDAELLIKREGLAVSKLKSISGNTPLVLHLLDPAGLVDKKPFANFSSVNLTIAASGLVKLKIQSDSATLDTTESILNDFMSGVEDGMTESIEIDSPSVRFLAQTFAASLIANRINPETLEFKILLPKMFSDFTPTNIGILTAVGIPAFLRYIKSSKVAETEGIFAQVKSSLQSEGRCLAPPLPPASSEIPIDGAKTMASFRDSNWAVFGMKDDQKMYFSYRVEKVNSDTISFIAETNFDGDPERNHTKSFDISFIGKPDSNGLCEVHFSDPVTRNEFK